MWYKTILSQRPYKPLNLAEWYPDALGFMSMTDCAKPLGDLAAHTSVSQIRGDADLEWYVMYVTRTTRVLFVEWSVLYIAYHPSVAITSSATLSLL
ncbi:hypothetical protein EJ05DRAFT_481300 [Pseudovirgaria hyperparasitica]|uniref:Uncharacterized protein n=1 Tax=Pseudovirgaria hyperparasitica TaxID=470096 RepID=A0A6A6VP64_9PEZI|nr:uncharacterized protein EJ05DRAFT_481300 [Pseudovirgaria hyperparasitica]KAF2752432.1 hypothetical protein EJ05DRAFT_481300 [Pseudovirgaria hyperparasitica]